MVSVKNSAPVALACVTCATELLWPVWTTPGPGPKSCLSATAFSVLGQQDLQAFLASLDESWLDSRQDLCPTSKKRQSAARAFRKHSQSHSWTRVSEHFTLGTCKTCADWSHRLPLPNLPCPFKTGLRCWAGHEKSGAAGAYFARLESFRKDQTLTGSQTSCVAYVGMPANILSRI